MSGRLTGAVLEAAWRGIGGIATAFARGALLLGKLEDPADLSERLVRGPVPLPPGEGPLAWLHGASLGEVAALAPLARELSARRPDLRLLVTTQTRTGRERAAREGWTVRLAPLDAGGPLARFLAAVRPAIHVVVETEIWPRRLAILDRAGIPAALVSARISPEREARYRRLRSLYARSLARLRLVAPASPADRDRLLALGLPADALGPTGNLKWDAVPDPGPGAMERARALLADMGLAGDAAVVLLASVHPGEAGPVVRALAESPGGESARCVVAPRHPERFDRVAAELAAAGYPPHRASAGPAPPGARVVLLDRLGVLRDLFPAAGASLLGGTLVPVGGHSPLEAAAAGCPVVAGPHVHHQEDLVVALAAAGGLVRVEDAATAGRTLARWLADPADRERAARGAREAVARHRGTAARLADLLAGWLP